MIFICLFAVIVVMAYTISAIIDTKHQPHIVNISQTMEHMEVAYVSSWLSNMVHGPWMAGANNNGACVIDKRPAACAGG